MSTPNANNEVPVLSSEQVVERLKAAVPSKAKDEILAFYSSVVGGITKEIGLMVVPCDDHAFHRGHAGKPKLQLLQVQD
jgi:hypothetical protein